MGLRCEEAHRDHCLLKNEEQLNKERKGERKEKDINRIRNKLGMIKSSLYLSAPTLMYLLVHLGPASLIGMDRGEVFDIREPASDAASKNVSKSSY